MAEELRVAELLDAEAPDPDGLALLGHCGSIAGNGERGATPHTPDGSLFPLRYELLH